MKRLAVLFLLCSCSTEPKTAVDALVQAANVAGKEIIRQYAAESMTCVAEASTREDSAECRAAVDAKWAPVKAGWDAMRTAQDMNDMEALLKAYCDVRKLYTMPDVGCPK